MLLILPGGQRMKLDSRAAQQLPDGWEWLGNLNGVRFTGHDASRPADDTEYALLNLNKSPFMLQLPDHSELMLNVGSSIRLPARFNGRRRSLLASGEIYFAVFNNRHHPFVVTTPTGTALEVLGTLFNLSAPVNKPERISLLEGTILLKKNDELIPLQAGQTALVGKGRPLLFTDAERVAKAAGWTWLEYTHRDIRWILTELGKRYRVSVHFEGELPAATSSGRFLMTQRLTDILQVLCGSHAIRTELLGDALFVNPA